MNKIEQIRKIDTKIYAGRLKDREILLKSFSGGAFTALSDYFLDKDTVVVAAIYNYQTHTEEFGFLYTKAERDMARGSKYVQSNPQSIFRNAELWLRENSEQRLLFVCMGCQAEGFLKFAAVKGLWDRVCIIDIICHGASIPQNWKEYIHSIEQKAGGKITYLTFKDKRNGSITSTAVAMINGNEIPIKDYVRVSHNCCALCPSCYKCPFATIERKIDIVIEDFWHIDETIPDFYNPDDISAFLIHTNCGEELFNNIKGNLEYRLSDTKQCQQANLEAPIPISEHSRSSGKITKEKKLTIFMKKYGTVSLKSKVKNKLLKVIRGRYPLSDSFNYHVIYFERRAV